MTIKSAGARFREAVATEHPLAVVGCVNAYFARLATQSGFKAIYLSGGGVAACSCGIPDLGITSLEDVLIDARRITDNVDTPLLVDIDVGWGGAFNIARTIKSMEKAGVAAVHIEDQVAQKRCGHRPNKAIVSKEEMVDRVKAAVDARTDENFVIMARTDALAIEGLDAAIERAQACVEAGADMIFPEAMTELGMYRQLIDWANGRVPKGGRFLRIRNVWPNPECHNRDSLSRCRCDPRYTMRCYRQPPLRGLRIFWVSG